jgi:intradiol ring-cleaving dioxygenase-like protein
VPSARCRISITVVSALLAAHAAAAENPRLREPTGWDVNLAPPGEPGEPFEMSGVVMKRDGTLMRNAKVFVYHAEAHGRYATSKAEMLHLAATLRTDSAGHYRIRSVFPGSYGYAAHVHFELPGVDGGMGFVNVRKDGQPSPQAAMSVPVKRAADGVWRLKWDLRPGLTGPTAEGAPRMPELRYPARAPADSTR